MGKAALNAKRGDHFYVDPESLVLVTDKSHPLYDPRVENPVDEAMCPFSRKMQRKGTINSEINKRVRDKAG